MTRTKACKILGIAADADMTEIKKTYRQLMHQVHPDTDAFHTIEYAYTAGDQRGLCVSVQNNRYAI